MNTRGSAPYLGDKNTVLHQPKPPVDLPLQEGRRSQNAWNRNHDNARLRGQNEQNPPEPNMRTAGGKMNVDTGDLFSHTN